MARAPILAAGGIVVRGGSKPLIAIVQRRKDNGWVLPKGKLKPKENPIAGARREAIEETGHHVLVHEFLGAISYEVGGSKAKIVQFWRMQAVDGPARKPMRDIKTVEWLPLPSAIEKLSLPVEQVFLRNVGPRALKLAAPAARKQRPVRNARSVRKPRTVRQEPSTKTPNTIMPSTIIEPDVRPTLFQQILWRFRRGAAGHATSTMMRS